MLKCICNVLQRQQCQALESSISVRDKWYRAYLKFFRKNDGVPVFQLVDKPGLVDFSYGMRVRKIKNEQLLVNFGEMKLIVYGIGAFDNEDPEFISIFDQLFKNKESKAIFGLIEEKDYFAHQCFAGDLLYKYEGMYRSLREVIIREKISYPSRIREDLNQSIFREFARFFETINNQKSIFTITKAPEAVSFAEDVAHIADKDEPIEVIQDRINLYEILGEGSFGRYNESIENATMFYHIICVFVLV